MRPHPRVIEYTDKDIPLTLEQDISWTHRRPYVYVPHENVLAWGPFGSWHDYVEHAMKREGVGASSKTSIYGSLYRNPNNPKQLAHSLHHYNVDDESKKLLEHVVGVPINDMVGPEWNLDQFEPNDWQPYVGPQKMAANSSLSEVVNWTMENGGGTWHKDLTPFAADSGFQISLYGMEEQVLTEDFDADSLALYINKHYSDLDSGYLGTWIDEGKVYLDVAIHFQGSLSDAVKLGRKNKQLAIWDWKLMDSIPILPEHVLDAPVSSPEPSGAPDAPNPEPNLPPGDLVGRGA